MARNNNNNQLLVAGAQQAIDQMKYEIAQEFGVNLGADTTSRANGSVGGEIRNVLSPWLSNNLAANSATFNNRLNEQLHIDGKRPGQSARGRFHMGTGERIRRLPPARQAVGSMRQALCECADCRLGGR